MPFNFKGVVWMDVVVPRGAGLDVAKDEVVACVRVPGDGKAGRRQETRTFSTFTAGFEALAGWLTAEGITEVVMEATGQYWKPIWYLLEDRGFDLGVAPLEGRSGGPGDDVVQVSRLVYSCAFLGQVESPVLRPLAVAA